MKKSETLYSVLVAPTDLERDQMALSLITHAERRGMSTLRENATDAEFQTILSRRIKNPAKQFFHGLTSVTHAEVRKLTARVSDEQRLKGDRFYYVLDTDIKDVPHHADIFATIPYPHPKQGHKAAWRKEREKLLELFLKNYHAPDSFRGGCLTIAKQPSVP